MNIIEYVDNLEAENADTWNSIMFLYNSVLKKSRTKIEILNDEFQNVYRYTPIEYVKSRIKTPESIAKKLKKNGLEDDVKSMVANIFDVAGIRVVCSFAPDIYRLADMIANQPDVKVLTVKDYIKNPKTNGYKSYHMIVTVPVYLINNTSVDVPIEMQIRTIAMDFWASLEHKIKYKFEGASPEYISDALKECADITAMLDARMYELNEAIHNAS